MSPLRDQWTAEPVTSAGEVSTCPAGAVVTGLFDQSGTLETIELLLCAPLAGGARVSDHCYNLPTAAENRDSYYRDSTSTPAETEGRSQCQLELDQAWAVVGISVNTDGSSYWVESLRCCRIDTA